MTTLLFLPITGARIDAILDGSEPQTLHEAVAALAAHKIVVGLESGTSPELVRAQVEQSLIAPLYESAGANAEQAEATYRSAIASFRRQRFAKATDPNIRARLERACVHPMSDRDLRGEVFLTPLKRHWRFDYARRATEATLTPASVTAADGSQRRVTRETARAASRLMGDFSEGGTLQGVAGCGKTQMLTDAVANTAHSPQAQVLVVALTDGQRQATRQRLIEHHVAGVDNTIRVVSLRDLLIELVSNQTRIGFSARRLSSAYHPPESRVAEAIGIHPTDRLNTNQVVQAVISQINRYCYSADSDITPEHCPAWVGRDPHETRIITECARRYWRMLSAPAHTQSVLLPLRLQHLWKIAELEGVTLPAQIASVFVDEAHDVPPALLRWLNTNTHAGIWLLGDEFQHYGHHQTPFFTRGAGYAHQLTHSYRCPRVVEDTINPLLARHPVNEDAGVVFEGHPTDSFRLRWRDAAALPEGPSIVVCANEFECLEYYLRLNHQGVGVSLFGRTRMDVPAYLRSLVGLYRDGQRPSVAGLRHYTQWGELANQRGRNPNFQRIQDMLARGFDYGDCDRICRSMGNEARAGDVQLALPETVKNHQFPRVELSNALLASVRSAEHEPGRLATALSRIYTAQTRATRELVLPGEYRYWLEGS